MSKILRKNDETLVEILEIASSPAVRMRGLLGRDGLAAGQGLHITPCTSIHTFFMRFDLDLIFMNRDLAVVKIVRGVTPFRVVFGGRGAHSVVEVQSGWLAEDTVDIGDVLNIG